jgi:hypothetical protein
MSFLAKLSIEDETMNVLDFRCSIHQETDKSGKPSANPNVSNLRFIVESTKSNMLFDLMASHSQTKSGKVTFYRRDAISKMRELEFSEAYCIEYHEIFLAQSSTPMQIEFVLSAKEISMNGSKIAKNWAAKF